MSSTNKRIVRAAIAAAAMVLLAGCSSGRSPLVANPVTVPVRQLVPVTFNIVVPPGPAGLKAAYVSASSKSIAISVNGGTGKTLDINAGQSPYSLTVDAPVGNDTFTVNLFSLVGGSGNVLSTAQIPATIVAGINNRVAVATQGVAASIQLSVDKPTPAKGSATTINLQVTAKDAAGNTIVGTYSQTISLTNSDTSGAVTLNSNTATGPGNIGVNYNGANIGPVTLSATAAGVSSSNVNAAIITPGTVVAANGATVTTLAGHPTKFFDGTGTGARFNYPNGVGVDSAGNIYVGDYGNNAIRKITPAGVVTTLAGGTRGASDGSGTAAQFNTPGGVAVDNTSGNIYVADYGNHLIRKVTPAGVVSLFAGQLTAGYTDGTGLGAQFNIPYDVAVDSGGNVLVADTGNNAIRKITPAGVTSTFAGGTRGSADGTGTVAQFNNPAALAIDSSDNVYVADASNNSVRKITSAGVVTTLAGQSTAGFTNGTGTAAQFKVPTGIEVDSNGTVYVADAANNALRQVSQSGVVTTLAGQAAAGYVDATGTAAKFSNVAAVAVDSSFNIYIADASNNLIRKVNLAGAVTTLAGGSSSLGDGTGVGATMNFPTGLTLDLSGNLYVADTGNNAIRRVTPSGVVSTYVGQPTAGLVNAIGTGAKFDTPGGVALDGNGNLFVADSGNNVIRVVTPGSIVATFAGGTGTGFTSGQGTAATFSGPTDITIDSNGNLFVTDAANHAIRMITPGGSVTTFAGNGTTGFANGTGTAATFSSPLGLSIDSANNLYIADAGNNAIRKITPNGVVTTFVGGTTGSNDGSGTAAQFSNPSGVVVDAGGTLYVADYNNNVIRKVTSAGVVTTLAGTAGVSGQLDGVGLNAQFSYPIGIGINSSGVIYVTDYGTSLIRKIQ